jgi:hypothetical protein
MGVYNMSYDFSETLKATILEINASNRMLTKEKEHQKELEEMQHQASDDVEELNFND